MRKHAATIPPPQATQSLLRRGLTAAFDNPLFMATVAAPLIGMAAQTVAERRHSRLAAQQKAQAFKEMVDLHPHFKTRDPLEVQRVFNSLHNVSPVMSRDPLVAGAWVDNVIESKEQGTNSHLALLKQVQDMSGTNKNVLDAHRATHIDHGHQANEYVRNLAGLYQQGRDNQFSKEVDRVNAEFKTRDEKSREEQQRKNDVWQARGSEVKGQDALHRARAEALKAREMAHDVRRGHLDIREQQLAHAEGDFEDRWLKGRFKTSSDEGDLGEMLAGLGL